MSDHQSVRNNQSVTNEAVKHDSWGQIEMVCYQAQFLRHLKRPKPFWMEFMCWMGGAEICPFQPDLVPLPVRAKVQSLPPE